MWSWGFTMDGHDSLWRISVLIHLGHSFSGGAMLFPMGEKMAWKGSRCYNSLGSFSFPP
jgi:hypothetical protein